VSGSDPASPWVVECWLIRRRSAAGYMAQHAGSSGPPPISSHVAVTECGDVTNTRKGARLVEARLRGLLLGGLAGDSSAYHAFLKDLSAHLRAFLRKRLVNLPEEVEDLVQELLLAVHNQRHTYDPRQPITAWVYAIARYKLVDLLRRRSRKESLNDPLDEEDDLLATSDGEAAEARRDLAKLLADLPERQRAPIIHMKIEGLSVAETARLTGMSQSAVKVGVHRGLKALAAKIRSES